MLVSPEALKVYTFIRTVYTNDILNTLNFGRSQHWHNYYQLVYVRRGSGDVIINSNVIPLHENDVIIIRPNEPHCFHVSTGKLETYELKFIFMEGTRDILAEEPRYFCTDRDGTIKRALKQIEYESDTMVLLSRDIIALELCKIFLLIRRALTYRDDVPVAGMQENSEDADGLLKKVDAFIEKNMHRNFTVRDIANHLFMEYSYFSRLFSARYGIRLKQYINQKRLTMAKELITDSNMTMTEIAVKCGFETLYRMERIFKKEEGLSPSAFHRCFRNRHAVMFDQNPETFYQHEKTDNGGNYEVHRQYHPCE